MTIPEIIVLRHGQTEWNRAGRMQGELDSPLTPIGEAQAKAMGLALVQAGIGPATHLFRSSPRGRALATAAFALPEGAQVVEDERLAEISVGLWTGLTRGEIVAATPRLSHASSIVDFYSAAPGGEGFGQLWDRCAGFLDDLIGPSVIVTHGITSLALRAMASGRGIDRIDALSDEQGAVYRVRDGRHDMLPP